MFSWGETCCHDAVGRTAGYPPSPLSLSFSEPGWKRPRRLFSDVARQRWRSDFRSGGSSVSLQRWPSADSFINYSFLRAVAYLWMHLCLPLSPASLRGGALDLLGAEDGDWRWRNHVDSLVPPSEFYFFPPFIFHLRRWHNMLRAQGATTRHWFPLILWSSAASFRPSCSCWQVRTERSRTSR